MKTRSYLAYLVPIALLLLTATPAELNARFLAIASTMGVGLSKSDIRRTREIVRRLSDDVKARSEQRSKERGGAGSNYLRRLVLPLLGSNQDSPDPEGGPL